MSRSRAGAVLAVCGLLLSSATAQDGKVKVKKKTGGPPAKREATGPADLDALPGFQIELLHTAEPAAEGSWINLANDGKGRLIIAGQRGHPILRATIKDGKVAGLEKLNLPISEAMGILYAFDSLYINGSGPEGFGLYRCRDTKNADQYDDIKFLKKFNGAGEHGPHGLALGRDNKIYIINGNHTDVPEGMSEGSPHRNYREDLLLNRQWDGNGHATGKLAPGGYVVRTDAEGKDWEFVLGGFRNAYDIAFNDHGELFTFDSDMEWDWGMPWYRPVRVNHLTSGAEFGWRSGTGKWPDYYIDSLPATANIGVGSPTGVTSGIGAKFPEKYRKAVYVLDWTYGRIIAVHPKPVGSTYVSTFENFVAPKGLNGTSPKKPLNVTDAVIGADGAMYFTTGGRNTQGALYRVTYTGPADTSTVAEDAAAAAARDLRRKLEAFHGKVDAKAVETAWPHLGSDDRYLRFAARVAIEFQPVDQWKAQALAETRPVAALTALTALVRYSGRDTQPGVLASLERLPLGKLDLSLQLDKLRVLGLSFIRQGRPTPEQARKLIAEIDPLFPSSNETLNRELSQVLIALQAPKIVEKCLKQMADAKYGEDRIHYLFHLRTLPIGQWTMAQRKEYFSYWTPAAKKLPAPETTVAWFTQAGRGYGDGSSYNNFMRNFLREAVANLSPAEHKELAPMLTAIDKAAIPVYDVKPRPVFKVWKTEEVLPLLAKVDSGRSFEKGREAYLAGQCIKCHRFGNEGGAVGPDLTAISSRFTRKDILESILEPSKVVSDQYEHVMIRTTDAKVTVGRVIDETPDLVVLQPNPLEPNRVEIKKGEIDARAPSKLSPMPEKLVDVLTPDEILDLIAYLESAGQKNYRSFRK